MKRLLNGNDWVLTGYLESQHTFNMEVGRHTGFMTAPFVPSMKVSVPGSVHNDLYLNGIIDDPFYDTNNLKSEWVENKNWEYKKAFSIDESQLNKKYLLTFDGVNNEARFYFNGEYLGKHFNTDTCAQFDLSGKMKTENEIVVLVECVKPEQPQMGASSAVQNETQRFAFGWDFSTRMIGLGIFKDVYLQSYSKSLLNDVSVQTMLDGNVIISGKTDGACSLIVELDGKNETFDVCNDFSVCSNVENPELWYPLNCGKQPLYDIKLTLKADGEIQDEKEMKIGFKKLEYHYCDGQKKGEIPYLFNVNGKNVYITGVNFLNLSHLLGAVSDSDYVYYFQTLKQLNINMIRLWGGGVLEKDLLYRLADQYGILVWQDFFQSSSGLDSLPSDSAEFNKQLDLSTEQTIRLTRSHVCLAVYCGGNEIRNPDKKPVTYDNPCIMRLKKIADRLAPNVLFHSSTPSGEYFVFDEKHPEYHAVDVHSPYAYFGKRHYDYCNKANYSFHGEFGANGCCDELSVLKMMPAKEADKFSVPFSVSWLNRNSGWYNCFDRDSELYGKEAMSDLGRYCAASQYTQAEAVRYIITGDRNRAFECGGGAIWQLNEPWPNSNCTTMVDFYKRRKHVAYVVKDNYAQVCANLKYDSLTYENKPFDAEICLSNLAEQKRVEVRCQVVTFDKIVSDKTFDVFAQTGMTVLHRFDEHNLHGVFFVRLTAKWEGGQSQNVYMFSTNEQEPFATIYDNAPQLKATVARDKGKSIVTVENVGKNICLFLTLDCAEKPLLSDDNFVTLLGGESFVWTVDTDKELTLRDFTRKIQITL